MGALHLLLWLFLCCGAAGAATIVGAGSNVAAQVYADARFAYRFANPAVEVQFYPSESHAGICRIENMTDECNPSENSGPSGLDFATATTILNQSDYDAYPDLQMYPVLATAIVPVYNLKGVKGLVLTRTALAQIFSGQITTWDDSRITAYNANFSQWNIPPKQKIQVVVRQDVSDITQVFKSAMYDFSSTFTAYVDVSPQPTWGKVNVTKLDGYQAVNSYLLQTPWAISYSVLQYAVDANLPYALIWKSTGVVVDASVKTTTFAVLEMGLDFGNNGDDPTRLTADLNYARGVNGWPIVTYTYVVLRKSTLRTGGTCAAVRDTVAFWQWILTAPIIQSIAEARYFVQPPAVVRDIVVQRLVSDVTCLGVPVFQAVGALEVTATGEATVATALQELADIYAVDETQMSMAYTPGPLNTSAAVAAALRANQFVAVRQPGLSPAAGAVALAFAGVALTVVSQYDMVLDVPTLVRILEGDIQTWLHADLLALNPGGFRDAAGDNITNTSQRIVLLRGPTADSGMFWDLMRRQAPGFVGRALQAGPKLDTEEQLQTVLAGMPFTLGIATSVLSMVSTRTKFASIQRSAGVAVAPSPASIRACAAAAPLSPTGGLDLAASTNSGCYPLSDVVYLIARTPQCANATADSVDAEAAAFLAWVLGDNGTAAALTGDGLTLLSRASPAVKAATAAALSSLSCSSSDVTGEDSASANIAPIVAGACIGAFVSIAVPVAWYLWKSTRDMRALQKQFSDVKVAEDCAEAIACFDLEAVSWLATLAKPSKIQLAFLRIVSLLVEVKPFIPDQLLAQLSAAKRGEDPPKLEPSRPPRPARKDRDDDAETITTSQSQSSLRSSVSGGRSAVVNRHDSKNGASEGSSGARRPPRGSRAAPGHQSDRFRRTCTYMFVRFTLRGDSEADRLGQLSTAVVAHVVTQAKAHGATIDKVTYDSVALHWNVSVQSAGAPLQATTLAMELACTAQILPPEAQDDLRLLMAIGHGPATVATVSAAGQRFFVVGGPEIANAVEVVMKEQAVPLGCTILLSNTVQQEVKFGFRCSPRLWVHDVLFWEPVEKRGGCKLDDEWMYQIQHMDQADTDLDVSRALQDVFLLAHTAQSAVVLQREVRGVQERHRERLSPQDLASLRNLCDSVARPPTLSVVSAV